MSTFVALYRGSTVAEARLIAVSADPSLVSDVSARLLERQVMCEQDPAMMRLEQGRRAALRVIKREADASESEVSNERDR